MGSRSIRSASSKRFTGWTCRRTHGYSIVADGLRPLLDPHDLGIIGGFYTCADACSSIPGRMVIRDVREELARTFLGVIPELSPVFIADSILSRSFYLSADLRGWADVPTVRSGEQSALGAEDLLALNAIDPDGAGCWFGSFRAERAPLSDEAHVVLARIARHLAFAHRLRRTFGNTGISAQSADAVLEPGGRIQQARGPAKGRHTRELLASAAVSIDRARSRRGQGDSLRAIQGWPELVSMRWTLVDHF